MEKVKNLKCACANCGEIIEYPPERAGQEVECPKCKEKSRLPEILQMAEPEALQERARVCRNCGSSLDAVFFSCPACDARRRKLTLLFGLGSAALLLAAGFGALAWFNRSSNKPARPPQMMVLSQPAVPRPKSLNDLKPGKFQLEQQRGSALVMAVGEVVNDSENVHLKVRVFMDLLDKQGVKLSTQNDFINQLNPHARWQPLIKVTDPRVAIVRFAGLREEP